MSWLSSLSVTVVTYVYCRCVALEDCQVGDYGKDPVFHIFYTGHVIHIHFLT